MIPSPRTFTTGIFLVVILTVLVGIRPFPLRVFSFAPLIKSAHTFSKDITLQLLSVILSQSVNLHLWFSESLFKSQAVVQLPDRLVPP